MSLLLSPLLQGPCPPLCGRASRQAGSEGGKRWTAQQQARHLSAPSLMATMPLTLAKAPEEDALGSEQTLVSYQPHPHLTTVNKTLPASTLTIAFLPLSCKSLRQRTSGKV